jgi:hypothetical protein
VITCAKARGGKRAAAIPAAEATSIWRRDGIA